MEFLYFKVIEKEFSDGVGLGINLFDDVTGCIDQQEQWPSVS